MDAGSRRRLVPAPVRRRAARPGLDQPGRPRVLARGPGLLARQGRRRVPDRRRPRAVQARRPRRRGRAARVAAGHPGRAPARLGLRRGAGRLRGLAAADRHLRPAPDARRRGVPVRRQKGCAVRRSPPAAPGVQLHGHALRVRRGRARGGRPRGAGALRHADVGAVQPRPGAARDAVRRWAARGAARPVGHRPAAGAAWRALPLPGRGAGARGGRGGAGTAPGPDLAAQRAHPRRARRLPYADAVGGDRPRARLQHRHALAAGGSGRRGQGRRPRPAGAADLPRAAGATTVAAAGARPGGELARGARRGARAGPRGGAGRGAEHAR